MIQQKGGKTMKYDFTTIVDRHGKDAVAVDLPEFFDPYKDGVT